MPLFLTLLISKLILKTSRLLYGGGGALPGLIALKLDPNIIAKLAKSLPEGSVLITGTNGKTTTTKMAADILEADGKKLVMNRSGSNLARGVASGLIERSTLGGKVRADLGLFEVDEASMPAVAEQTKPKAVVVTNLFRDQLDRYGELDKTAKLIGDTLAKTTAHIVLNADDPLVANLASYTKGERVKFFGVEDYNQSKLAHDFAADSNNCPVCGRALIYKKAFFGHVGHYHCEGRDFKRPAPDFELEKQLSGSNHFKVKKGAFTVEVDLKLPGLYNAYNALAALTLTSELYVDLEKAAEVLGQTQAAFGRVEEFENNGSNFLLLLIKNPTGFNQVIQTFLQGPPAQILIAINDNFADGRDVSWLWDVAIEDLAAKNPKVIVGGIRAYDMALRLKYAGIQADIEPDLAQALQKLENSVKPGQKAYILPTYTAMLELRWLIGKRVKLGSVWK